MTRNLNRRSYIVLFAVGLCVTANSQQLLSGEPGQRDSTAAILTDIKLGESGRLVGFVVDGQGNPVDKAKVRIFHHDRRIAAATTNVRGLYIVKGLRGGVHVVRAGNSEAAFRFWTNKSAPPIAKQSALNVSESTTIRGQMGDMYGGNPAMVGLGAVAIAGLVVAIDKQESINDLKTAISQLEQQQQSDSFRTSGTLSANLDPIPVSP